jgi:hypothetical protein
VGVGLDWLGWIPLFTPFVTLMAPPGSIGALEMVVQFAGMIAATVGFGWLATRAMTSEGMRQRVWVLRSGDRRAAGGRRAGPTAGPPPRACQAEPPAPGACVGGTSRS